MSGLVWRLTFRLAGFGAVPSSTVFWTVDLAKVYSIQWSVEKDSATIKSPAVEKIVAKATIATTPMVVPVGFQCFHKNL